MSKYLLTILLLISYTSTSLGALLPEKTHERIIQLAMDNYWGKTKLKDGSLVMPKNDEERRTIPIDLKNAGEIIQAGELSGVAAWCGLNWKNNYLQVTKSARKYGLDGKKVAFIGLLHGVSMGIIENSLKEKQCSKKIKRNIKESLHNISNMPIDFTPSVSDAQTSY